MKTVLVTISLLGFALSPRAEAFTDIHVGLGFGGGSGWHSGWGSGWHDPYWHHGSYWHSGYGNGYGYSHWRGGYWHHGPYGGRTGWWWVVGPNWNYYDQPVYPYPEQYSNTYVIQNPAPTVAAPLPPSVPAPAPVPPPPPPPPVQPAMPSTAQPMLYYCPSSNSYYPYVRTCPEGWQQQVGVPAQ